VLQKWTHVAQDSALALVLPDGCRDIIRIEYLDGCHDWHVSSLQSVPEHVALSPGAKLTGYRLRPGTRIAPEFVTALEYDSSITDEDVVHAVDMQARSVDAIQCLASVRSIEKAAALTGVSVRSLHRILVKETGKSPVFWLRLARARRAAQERDMPLADAAAEHGFSDQAHMAREFRHWFGVTPRALRADASIQEQLAQPALATGEQISIKNPLMSDT